MKVSNHPRGKKIQDVNEVLGGFEELGYIADRGLATVVYLLSNLGMPVLLEGQTGLGKTEVAKVLARFLDAPLIRLQCYEGLDVNSAVYEWNYQKQLLAIKLQESTAKTVEEKEKYVFGPDFLLERPLLQAVRAETASPVLLIDEVDRADEAFEAFLLELLSDFQVSVPELGTIRAKHRPYVVLTSNRTRELSEALRRRCLYHWIEYPSLEKELKIVSARLPGIDEELSRQVVGFVQALRGIHLGRSPGVAETLDWAQSLMALDKHSLDQATVEGTLGCLAKSLEDTERIKSAGIERIISQVC
ncbi:MAG: MoxR family ATPase [Acidobacteria bacterium]|nr:MoxR family ATPase [Acidobacteriota bacterium]